MCADWDVMLDSGITNKVYAVYIGLNVVSLLTSIISFFFYDLTGEMQRRCVKELLER